MFRILLLLVALVSPGLLTAQDPQEVLRQYSRISESVVQIRSTAEIPLRHGMLIDGKPQYKNFDIHSHGSGIVVGEVEISGRTEYLVLTNHHVADFSLYVDTDGVIPKDKLNNRQAVPTRKEVSYLIEEPSLNGLQTDISLIEVLRDPRGDLALMRTVGATRELSVYRGAIDRGQVRVGALAVTSGYPLGKGRQEVYLTQFQSAAVLHLIGFPHTDIVLDHAVEGGHSGGPVFAVEERDGQIVFTLIGLAHALHQGKAYVVPIDFVRVPE